MRFYNVIVKNGDDDYCDRLRFSFYSQEEAFEFAKHIIEISEYDVEILQCEDEEDENGEVQTN